MKSDQVTLHRWKITNFRNDYDNNRENNRSIFCGKFSLKEQPSIAFSMFFKPALFLDEGNYGINLKSQDNGQPVNVDLEFWLDDGDGQKFCKHLVQKHTFNKINDQFQKRTKWHGKDLKRICDVYSARKHLFICCEVRKIDLRVPALELREDFHQNIWSTFENGLHDTIVKVGQTEFKISKIFFMAQSDVFTRMFNSNFNEASNNAVEIKGITENTMKDLVKWLYTGQIKDDEANVEELFEVADKYNIVLLKKTCKGIMLDNLNKSNAFSRFIVGFMLNEQELKDAALNVISGMSIEDCINTFMSPYWLEFSRKDEIVANEIASVLKEKFSIK